MTQMFEDFDESPFGDDFGTDPFGTPTTTTASEPVVAKSFAGYSSISVDVSIALGPFGLPFSSLKLGSTQDFATPLTDNQVWEAREKLAEQLTLQATTDLARKVVELVKETTKDLPQPAAPAYASNAPLGGGQAPASGPAVTGTNAANVGALMNGQATAGAGNVVKIALGADKNGKDQFLFFPHPSEFGHNEFREQATAAFAALEDAPHPSMFAVFDNRESVMDTGKGFAAGRIVVSKNAPEWVRDHFGKKGIGWVRFDRYGKMAVAFAPELRNAPLKVRAALAQGIDATAPQASSERPF